MASLLPGNRLLVAVCASNCVISIVSTLLYYRELDTLRTAPLFATQLNCAMQAVLCGSMLVGLDVSGLAPRRSQQQVAMRRWIELALWFALQNTLEIASIDGLGPTNGSLAAVADVLRARHGLVSCQAKMLLGMGCHAPTDRLTRAQIASAAALVRDRLAFVGLSERYRESVCLWHATYGGAVWSFEVQGSRDPGPEHDASVLGANFTDEADDIVYAAAQERFGNEVRRTGTSVRIGDCLRNVALLK